ncbi:hypothetical protein DWQ65_07095 [Treponema phagedenis]|uniref:Uncharacterized protein n=1 Tax=Treponema phagedenis TaxID=162 RepID=A0A0B7GVT1_TREPH|nr:hypothetical protein HMPREF9554_00562 [Treponema phagedenis F0421]QEJ94883.1 hypothetical protein FUT79_06445 [Treponema phagedenis]QEJ97868.1 hypothetical protein FUT82_07580 [Treponema phagedenis]QEK00784.1 hypothetical protein FUT84_06105 [Treponema phagedenis]QEK03435.1 hypothetical protein FUT83_06195 [Treponema phagedenis]
MQHSYGKLVALANSKQCFKASTQNYKTEALKLVGEVKKNSELRPCTVSSSFYKIDLIRIRRIKKLIKK